MKSILFVIAVGCTAPSAFAQPVACETGYHVATRTFVEAFNGAGAALTRRDFAGALELAAIARPEAAAANQRSAVMQIEVSAYVGLDDRSAASSRMKASLADPCTPEAVRARYVEKLAEWGVAAN